MSLVGPGNWDPSNHWNRETAEEYIAGEEVTLVNRFLGVFYRNKKLKELNGREIISLAASLNNRRYFNKLKKINK